MHMFNKEREESCHTEAGYVHLHCMNFYRDIAGTYLVAHNQDDKGETSSVNGTIGIIIIGVIIILVGFCMVLMLYELLKYRAKRSILNSHAVIVGRTRQRLRPQYHRRNIEEGPLPYLSRPPNYYELCLSDKELPSFEDATTTQT